MSRQGPDQIKVLVLIKGLGIGGAEKLISEASRFWDMLAHQYTVAYVLPWKNQLVEELRGNQVEVHCVGGSRGTDPSTALRVRKLIRDLRPDVIHAHLPSAGILARVVSRVPVVYTEHNVASSYRAPTRWLNRVTYGRNAAVVCVSDAVAQSVENYRGPHPRVIPNGVSSDIHTNGATVREDFGIKTSAPLVVHVGNIRPHKGHETLIEATTKLVASIPDAVVLSIGGEKHDGDLNRVRGQAERAGVSQSIRFLGRQADARRFLAAADLVVNPSDIEGLPVAILEALSLGRPVVATDVGGVGSVVVHEVTGLLVPPSDPAALADAMTRSLTSQDAAAWGRAGAELVASNHSIERMVHRYETLYREVLGV